MVFKTAISWNCSLKYLGFWDFTYLWMNVKAHDPRTGHTQVFCRSINIKFFCIQVCLDRHWPFFARSKEAFFRCFLVNNHVFPALNQRFLHWNLFKEQDENLIEWVWWKARWRHLPLKYLYNSRCTCYKGNAWRN